MTPDRGAVRDLIEALVRAESPSGEEEPAARALVEHLEAWGLEVERDAVGNVVAHAGPRGDPAARATLLGHLDTVPGQLPVRWEDGVLHGRGAVDAKGPLAAHAAAAARAAEDADVRVRLVAAVGEEADGRGARHLVDTGRPPEALIVAEPTGTDTVGLGYKGRVHARLTARAPRTHAGEPTPTASERLLDAVDRLTAWTGNPERDVAFDEPTLRVEALDSARGPDEARATARLDLRVPGQAPTRAELADTLPEAVEVEVLDALPAVRASPRNPVATALRGALRAHGREPRAAVKTGTSDWNVLAQAWAPPAAAYGPGDPALDHTARERIALDEVLAARDVLADALARLADPRLDAPPARTRG